MVFVIDFVSHRPLAVKVCSKNSIQSYTATIRAANALRLSAVSSAFSSSRIPPLCSLKKKVASACLKDKNPSKVIIRTCLR